MTYDQSAKPSDGQRESLGDFMASRPGGPRRKPNIVYFILATQTKRVKIGIAVDPWSRLANLQTGCPDTLVLLGGIFSDEARQLEQELHACYADWHFRGEWFDMYDDFREHLEEMCAEDREAIWAMQPPPIDEPREPRRPVIPAGVEVPKGRGAKLARYKLARGIA